MDQRSTSSPPATPPRLRPRTQPVAPTDEAAHVSGASAVTVIDAEAPRTKVELRDLWRARETALMFAWRDVKVRYKQSLIGIAWAVIQPVTQMVVFTIIFGKFAKFPSQGLPYPVFLFTAILPWQFFASSLTQIGSCVQSNKAVLQKVYFPRLILPISGLLVPAIDFACAFVVMFGILLWYDIVPQVTTLLAPLFLLLLAVTALGVGSVLATLNARFRDVPYAIPFLVQIWFYVSPILYPSAELPEKWQQVVVAFNPVVAPITGFRWAVTGTPPPTAIELGAGMGMGALFLIVGFWVFRSGEARFADTV